MSAAGPSSGASTPRRAGQAKRPRGSDEGAKANDDEVENTKQDEEEEVGLSSLSHRAYHSYMLQYEPTSWAYSITEVLSDGVSSLSSVANPKTNTTPMLYR